MHKYLDDKNGMVAIVERLTIELLNLWLKVVLKGKEIHMIDTW